MHSNEVESMEIVFVIEKFECSKVRNELIAWSWEEVNTDFLVLTKMKVLWPFRHKSESFILINMN